MQRDAGGPVGGGGPLWPRLVGIAGDKAYAGFLPDAMVQDFPDVRQHWARFEHPDWAWPQLTPLLMSPGDAVVLLHSCPHSPTPNYSDDPRINVYYRLRRWRPDNPLESDDPRIASWHGTDHPDRARAYGPDGGFLDYSASPGYDPFATSIDRLCDHWADWGEDMQALAADRRRAREAVGTSRL